MNRVVSLSMVVLLAACSDTRLHRSDADAGGSSASDPPAVVLADSSTEDGTGDAVVPGIQDGGGVQQDPGTVAGAGDGSSGEDPGPGRGNSGKKNDQGKGDQGEDYEGDEDQGCDGDCDDQGDSGYDSGGSEDEDDQG